MTTLLPSCKILPSIRLDFTGDHRLGPGKIMLLERIMQIGSISAAGRGLEMSYRRAWLLVDAMNQMFDEPIVIATTGGPHGGGAEVTDFGRRLVATYRTLEKRVADEANSAFTEFRAHLRPAKDRD
ncbi:MAG: LysR family transcriptional regulator [Xanthobacteraceae bacterium]|nr:MAG: LysR family transcriptional regulator [Xanthobacteraceae bacterium]